MACDREFDAPDWYAGDAGDAGPADGGTDAAASDAGAEPTGAWVNVTSNLAALPSACGNLSAIAAKPDEDSLLVGVQDTGVYASRDGGETWQQTNAGPGGAKIPGGVASFLFDPTDPLHYWITVVQGEHGVYETRDDGHTFIPVGDVRDGDLLSVDFSDPQRKLMLLGGHAQPQALGRSDDGGQTWRNIGAGLPADRGCSAPHVINPSTFIVGCDFMGQGIFRTTDGGASWAMVHDTGGAAAPLATPSAGIFFPARSGALLRSSDDGVSWEEVSPMSSLKPLKPVLLPDGRIAALGAGGVTVSADAGKTWRRVSVMYPFEPDELTYSERRKAFYIRNSDCGAVVLPDAVARFDFDYATDHEMR